MAELTLEQKLKKITATVKEVEINQLKKIGVVSVELSDGVNKWYKPFGISFESGLIKWEAFKIEIQKAVKKDYEKDLALSEIYNMKGKVFKLF